MTPSSSGQLVWTGPSGGSWSNSANWTDPVDHNHYAPSSTDQLLFGDGGAGADTDSTMDYTSLTVDRVVMDSHYTHTLTISSGHTLTTTNYFQQYGTLSMTGTAKISTGTYIDIYGTVSVPASGGTTHLDATGDFFLYSSSGAIATFVMGAGASLEITSANFSDSGAITVGTSTGSTGTLTINGPFTQSAGTITVNAGSLLTFDSLGSSSAYPVFQSTVSMKGGGAEIDSDTQLAFSGGTLSVTGSGANTIGGTGGGNLRVYNSGTISVGVSGTSSSALSLTTGDLTVGALDPAGSGTGGTLNLYTSSTLSMPAASGTNAFDVTELGVINMYGATITMSTARVASLDIHAGSVGLADGQLNSYGTVMMGMGIADDITGNVHNDGTIIIAGSALHSLTIVATGGVGGNYTQSSSGTLEMRLDNSAKSDVLTVGGTADLDGTLSLTGLHSLTAPQTWTIITTVGGITGDFDTFDWPDGGNWASAFAVGGKDYTVTKS
jgi:hypothetical protein